MRNRIRLALEEQDLEELVVVNAGGMILCVRLADIAWVRAVERGVELKIGGHTHLSVDSFASWQAKLPPDRFAQRGDSLLVNTRLLRRPDLALYNCFPAPSESVSSVRDAANSRRRRQGTAPRYRNNRWPTHGQWQ